MKELKRRRDLEFEANNNVMCGHFYLNLLPKFLKHPNISNDIGLHHISKIVVLLMFLINFSLQILSCQYN